MNAEPPLPGDRAAFSLEGRPAAGLYLVGWLCSGIGLALLVLAMLAGPQIGPFLLFAALAFLAAGLSSAAGYQIVARLRRDPSAYRGPSPLILFGLQLVLANALGAVLLIALGLPDARSNALAFLAATLVIALSYATIVAFFVVRSGALSWRELGVPLGAPLARIVADLTFGALAMLIAWFPITLFAALVAVLLGTRTANVVPIPSLGGELILVAIGAALLVPIGEELFFRGAALTAWLRDLGARSALVRSALLFAFVHTLNIRVAPGEGLDGARQALLTVVVIAPVGIVLGWLFLRRGLVASIAGHATFNLVGVMVLALARDLPQPTGP